MIKIKKNEKGITLVALVVTIIILLILAGITIGIIMKKNGIISRASEAVVKYKISELEERINLAIAEYKTYMEKETLYTILNKIKGLESISPDTESEGPPYTLILEGYEFLIKGDLSVEYVRKADNSILPNINSIKKLETTDKQVIIEISSETKDRLGLKEIRIIKNGIEVDKIENLNEMQTTKTYNITGNGKYKVTVIANNGTQVTSEEINITELKTTTGTIQKGTNINRRILLTVKANSEDEIKKVYIYDSFNNLIDTISCNGTDIEVETSLELEFYENKVCHAMIETDYENVLTNNIMVANEEYIKTESDFFRFAGVVNGGTDFSGKRSIKQLSDITLKYDHIAIGTTARPFNGIYDGQGHSVKNVKVNGKTDYDYGLFGYVQGSEDEYAEIRNLTVEGDITGTYNVGGIAGRTNYANIKNCTNKATVRSTGAWVANLRETVKYSSTGGIVGRMGENRNRVYYRKL